ncbi:MAG: NusG domain II-containing protein [Peptoniphilaceae bacterium]|uniref:NusG domain II-containing protein n=1 Tax=Parvimonas sp. TaxID=1944660 RepID=UPI0025D230EC|nr:NusG domain II-containing protein [Parvimonas sp.]MCI5997763.1 NusG domain II-containing protein [Parvimonas sp.]MDD7765312.1 NusG domain II-containing protein [Peptoniphilaceae bacterium]MDY3050924.1 NusG domain II-containing protein [Parvimonas sp.]
MKKGDFILIFSLLGVFIISFFYINSKFFYSNDKYISVQVNGKEIKKITFGNEKKVYPIRTSFGLNILEVDEFGVRVIEASCPDKLDVKFGKIDKVGQAIICLPNRLVVEIKSNSDINELDVVN